LVFGLIVSASHWRYPRGDTDDENLEGPQDVLEAKEIAMKSFLGTVIIAAAVLVAVSSGQTQQPGAPAALKKVSGTARAVEILAITTMAVGDQQKHDMNLVRRLDVGKTTDSSCGSYQAPTISAQDLTGGSGPFRGYQTITCTSGDKIFSAFEGTTKAVSKPNGPPEVTFEGRFRWYGGTGQYVTRSCEGTFRGQMVPLPFPAYEYECSERS
jgi:hypothetical protein